MAKRARDAEEIKKRKMARLRFRNLIRSVALNRIWLMDTGDQKLSLNVKKNVSMLVRPPRKIGLLTMTKIRARLSKVIKFMVIGEGRTLIREGDPPTLVYFILTGEVEVSKKFYDHITDSWVNKVLMIIGPGETIGEVELLEGCARLQTYVTTVLFPAKVIRYLNFSNTIVLQKLDLQTIQARCQKMVNGEPIQEKALSSSSSSWTESDEMEYESEDEGDIEFEDKWSSTISQIKRRSSRSSKLERKSSRFSIGGSNYSEMLNEGEEEGEGEEGEDNDFNDFIKNKSKQRSITQTRVVNETSAVKKKHDHRLRIHKKIKVTAYEKNVEEEEEYEGEETTEPAPVSLETRPSTKSKSSLAATRKYSFLSNLKDRYGTDKISEDLEYEYEKVSFSSKNEYL
uniref:Cyclic nucleotide-binding domain-containing protein n=1 Tax=Glossina brevipalpis TaxID=37001 RepID=A0A1A9WPT2_9MUSC